MEIKCPLWKICGGGITHDYWAKQFFPYGDPRRDYVGKVCCDENSYSDREHYKIRFNPMGTTKQNKEIKIFKKTLREEG